MRVGQPKQRVNRAYRWCARTKRKDNGARVAAVFTGQGKVGLIGSTARGHTADGLGPNRPAANALADATLTRRRPLRRPLRRRRRPRLPGAQGEIEVTALATPAVASSRAKIAKYLRLGGLTG